jgi:hypothetical protein
MRVQLIPAVLAVLVSCTEPASSPSGAIRATVEARRDAVKFWETNAAVYWSGVARRLVADNNSNALVALRGYAVVALAQYNAAIAAEDESKGDTHPRCTPPSAPRRSSR